MALSLQINKRFEINTRKVYTYLAGEFGFKTADAFIDELYERISGLTITPYSGIVTDKVKGIRKIIISRHNKVYYRIKDDRIIILTLFASKMNPSKNKYE
jgi:plasmid stabilization system protein ParE